MFRFFSSTALQLGLHGLTVFWLGLMAGFFWTYSANVNFATLQMDGSTYALVQSSLNRNVRHAMFFSFFFGPPLLCALTVLAAWPRRRERWLWCLGLAGVLYALGIVVFTARVNLPLNAYTESWNPQALPSDWAQTRERWNAANLWRTVASAAAFALALFALCVRAIRPHGQAESARPLSSKHATSHAPAQRRFFRLQRRRSRTDRPRNTGARARDRSRDQPLDRVPAGLPAAGRWRDRQGRAAGRTGALRSGLQA
jgi:uncharacterized membrane protein